MDKVLNPSGGNVVGNQPALETHPWEPYMPDGAKVLIMGTFPPQPHRWSMNFYYPNRTNDFWKVMGIIYFNDPAALYDAVSKSYRVEDIKLLLDREGIAMNDTGYKVRRLRDNASDKFLEIVEPVNLKSLLEQMPDCQTVVTTGEKAAGVVAELTDTEVPKTGSFVDTVYKPLDRQLRIWRMPSTSRAYPLSPERKADFYRRMLEDVRKSQIIPVCQ